MEASLNTNLHKAKQSIPATPQRIPVPHDRFSPAELNDFCKAIPNNIAILLTHEGTLLDEYQALADGHSNLEIHDLSKYTGAVQVPSSADEAIQSITETFSSISTPLIWERGTTSVRERVVLTLQGNRHSYLKGSCEIVLETLKWKQILTDIEASLIIFATTPHNIRTWTQAQAAFDLGVPVATLSRSAVNGFLRIYRLQRDSRRPWPTEQMKKEKCQLYQSRLDHWVRLLQSSYNEAMPNYERMRAIRTAGKYVTLRGILRNHWKAPLQTLNTMSSWRALKKVSKSNLEPTSSPFAVFFLHYQPERTTVPDGGLFGAQINAIVALRAGLPDNVRLFIKEHPSTFRNNCDPLARDPDFYNQVASIEGVEWIDISIDSFELIDKSRLTATITGTVALESLIRGTPSIMFGSSFFGRSEGFLEYKNSRSLQIFLQDVFSDKFTPDKISSAIQETLAQEMQGLLYCGGDAFSERLMAALSMIDFAIDSDPLKENGYV